ncbi:hypothetical protein Taro_005014 [Colocasia esculenta]|uniref:Aminotransferase-like plant mobile domain-containing protein n=1 Tax=Colocasia esculenta TaxID=4460 RepID=A0A843TWM8_COLES|nr:hypothetical protein [Colocasia esculenta]
MGFGEVLRMERMRADPVLTQALRSRWDMEATAFVFPWGHMIPSLEDVTKITGLRVHGRPVSGFTYPCYRDLAGRLLGLTVGQRSSLIPRVALQESLGLYDVGNKVGETADDHLQRLTRGCQAELADEPGAEADMDLRRFLILFLGRLLFATRGDAVHCRFLPLLEDLSEVWTYLHLPGLGRGILARPGFVPIVRQWDSRGDTRTLSDQLTHLQEAIDCYPQLDIQNWERRGKGVKSSATTDDAYLQAYALKYGGKVYKSARRQVDVAGETASLRALLYSAMQDREAAQREAVHLLERVRRAAVGGASSSRTAKDP